MPDHTWDLDFDSDVGSAVTFSPLATAPDDGGWPRHHRARHPASRHRADDATGSLGVVRHRGSLHVPDDAGHEMVGYALLISAVGVGALAVTQLSSLAVNGMESLITGLQACVGG